MATKSFTVSSVPGSGSKTFNETGFMDWAVITSVKVSIQSGGSGGSYQFQLHRKDTHLDADLAYNTEAVTGTYRDPVQDDDGTITTNDNHQGALTPYEDQDASTELHGKIINNDAAVRSFDVVIDYLPLVPGTLTVGSVLFAVTGGGVGQDNANFFWDDSNNRLGLGTASPLSSLHVQRDVDNTTDPAKDENALVILNNEDANGYPILKFRKSASTGTVAGAITFGIGGGAATDEFRIVSRLDHATVMEIKGDGNVGIGTTSPQSPLHVLAAGTAGTPSIGSTVGFVVQRSGAAGAASAVAVVSGNTGTATVQLGDTDSELQGALRYDNNADDLLLFTSGTEKLRIQSNGNVGIGTTSPAATAHVQQKSTTGAIAVLELDQDDVDQPFIDFDVTTIGVGNSIEAVGAKTLTTTHFIMIDIEGVGIRYIPAGTIA